MIIVFNPNLENFNIKRKYFIFAETFSDISII